jgi:hypothetical protein
MSTRLSDAKITEVDPSGVGVGGIEEGGFYSTRPRTEEDRNKKWVINMDTVERGWRDERDAAQRALKPPKTGPFTPDEDEQIKRLVNEWPAGKRGMWAYVGRRVNRHEQHCMLRWTQHINAEYQETKEKSVDIIRDSEYNGRP